MPTYEYNYNIIYIRKKMSQYEYDFKYIYTYAYNVTLLSGYPTTRYFVDYEDFELVN